MCRQSDQELNYVGTTSITTWLNAHPVNPTKYESVDWVGTSPERRKRHMIELSPSKRPQLKEITVNQISEAVQRSSRPHYGKRKDHLSVRIQNPQSPAVHRRKLYPSHQDSVTPTQAPAHLTKTKPLESGH